MPNLIQYGWLLLSLFRNIKYSVSLLETHKRFRTSLGVNKQIQATGRLSKMVFVLCQQQSELATMSDFAMEMSQLGEDATLEMAAAVAAAASATAEERSDEMDDVLDILINDAGKR